MVMGFISMDSKKTTQYIDANKNGVPDFNFDTTHYSHNDLRANKFRVEFREWVDRDNINLRDLTAGIVMFNTPSITNPPLEPVGVGNFSVKEANQQIVWGDGEIVFRNTSDLSLYLYVYHNMLRYAENPIYDHQNDRLTQQMKYKNENFGMKPFRMELDFVITDNHNNEIYRLRHYNVWFKFLDSLKMNVLETRPDVLFQRATFSCDRVEFIEI